MSDQNESLCDIKEFTAFLEKCLGQKVIDYKLKALTKPGDNYGSIIQSADVTVAGNTIHDKNEILHLVSKSFVTNPYLIEVFQSAITFVKETHLYSDIIPALQLVQLTAKVSESDRFDAFIQCAGSRISLNPNATFADSDAVLLLENTKYSNFVNIDKHVGFDSAETLAILKTLAQFHALMIGMRRLLPNLFRRKVSLYLNAVNFGTNDDDNQIIDNICDGLKFVDDLDTERRAIIEKQLRICDRFGRNTVRTTDTPFTTIIHRDLWTNNIMIKKDDRNDGIQVKIYDFQLYCYESFVCDLIFFLFTSVRCNDLAKNFELFIYHYHLEFVKTIKMWEEVQRKAKIELLHSLFIVKVVLADKSVTSIDDISPDTFFADDKPSNAVLNRWKCIFSICKDHELI